MSEGLTRILKPVTAIAGLTCLAAAAAVLTQSSETLLRSSFARALAPSAGDQLPAVQASASVAGPIAGTEEFWLSAMGRDTIKTSGKAPGVSLGDSIILTLDGKERSYRVTSVSDISPVTHIDTRARVERVLLITAKDTADALARPIRFVIDLSDPGQQAVAGSAARPS
jgi:hypothetical protein